MDFEALQAMNPDIYAWIEIPDTDISYAVLRREGDNNYYMNHAENGSYYSGGCIFSDDFNSPDMTDPVTILYGHNLRNGTMFAKLNDFADPGVFAQASADFLRSSTAPENMFIYQIFFAGVHSNEHLLLNYDFTSHERTLKPFFTDLKDTRSLHRAAAREADLPAYGEDKKAVLSTCFRGNNRQRFLVPGAFLAEIRWKYQADN